MEKSAVAVSPHPSLIPAQVAFLRALMLVHRRFPLQPKVGIADLSTSLRSGRKSSWEGVLCQRLWFPTLATQGMGHRQIPLGERIQNRHQSRAPHLWRALCARYGKRQIFSTAFRSGRDDKGRCNCQPSLLQPDFHPLGGRRPMYTPVEMTKLGAIANPALPQPEILYNLKQGQFQ